MSFYVKNLFYDVNKTDQLTVRGIDKFCGHKPQLI